MSSAPPRQRLADLLLGRPVLEFISERRANGASYRRIAADICDATSGEIDVTDMTIRTWWLATPEGQRERHQRAAAKESDQSAA